MKESKRISPTCVRFHPKTLAAVDKHAEHRGVNRTDIIKLAVFEWLEREQARTKKKNPEA